MKKRILLIMMAMFGIFALTGCFGDEEVNNDVNNNANEGNNVVSSGNQENLGNNEVNEDTNENPGEEDEVNINVNGSEFLKTKTGKFYSQFSDEKMHIEYEINEDDVNMKIITVTNGEKTYSESFLNGTTVGTTILEGTTMYTIDHKNKMILKMDTGITETTAGTSVLTEDDVDMATFKTGTRTIDGKTYDTEEMTVDGSTSIMCFEGNNLVYIIGVYDGSESMIKITKVSSDIDESLFEIPSDYQVVEM